MRNAIRIHPREGIHYLIDMTPDGFCKGYSVMAAELVYVSHHVPERMGVRVRNDGNGIILECPEGTTYKESGNFIEFMNHGGMFAVNKNDISSITRGK